MNLQKVISKYCTGKEYYELEESYKKIIDEKIKIAESIRLGKLKLAKLLRRNGFIQGKWFGGSMIKGAGSYRIGFIIELRYPTANFLDVSYHGSEENKKKFFDFLKTIDFIDVINNTEVYLK